MAFEKYMTWNFNGELRICASENQSSLTNILVPKKRQPTVPRQSLAKVSELLEVCGESGPVLVPKERYHQYQTKEAEDHYCEC